MMSDNSGESGAGNLYKKFSAERKELQEKGLVPDWYSTAAYQTFKTKYEYETNGRSVRGQFERIANTAAKHLVGTKWEKEAADRFFELLWEGDLGPSTPVMANTGTDRGLPVSCSGSVIEDSVDGFYSNRKETALLTKYGFGTSAYLGDIRPRGSPISVGGKASGIMPVVKGHIQDMRDVAQGTARRGAWAGYLPLSHGDFDELADHALHEPDDCNIGWIITDEFQAALDSGDKTANERFKKSRRILNGTYTCRSQ
jgi:ribonucleoside-diphosphate reductase alpha chain